MTEADLVLAKAFLLFSVAGYTIVAANTNPLPRHVSRAATGWAAIVVTGMTGDRSALATPSVSDLNLQSVALSASLPLALGQRPTIFSSDPGFIGAPAIKSAVSQDHEGPTQASSIPPLHSSLSLPPVLAETGFQFRF